MGPGALSPALVAERQGDATPTSNSDNAIRNAEAIVPDLELVATRPSYLRVDKRDGAGTQIHSNHPLRDADLRGCDGSTKTVIRAECIESSVKRRNLRAKMRRPFCYSSRRRLEPTIP
jgi:hypothetical protein